MSVDDGTECESISERGGHVAYVHGGVTGARDSAPVQQGPR